MQQHLWNHHENLIKRTLGCFAAVAAAAVAGAPAFGQCSYEITKEFVGPGWPTPITHALGLSDNGIVVGRYEIGGTTNWEAFMWVPDPDAPGGGVFTTLPRPSGVISAQAMGVNSHGIVIGRHQFTGVGWKAFAYDSNTGAFTYLDSLHPIAGAVVEVSTATAINDDNIVTGSRIISEPGVSPTVSNAVIWLPYGENGEGDQIIIDLGVGDGPNSRAEGGNDGIDAAGWTGVDLNHATARAVFWNEDGAFDLGVLPGGVQSQAHACNNALRVVGTSRIPNKDGPGSPPHGFRWTGLAMIPMKSTATLHTVSSARHCRFWTNRRNSDRRGESAFRGSLGVRPVL